MAIRFGVIFISDFTIDCKAKQLRSILERKRECNFIWFSELSAVIHIFASEEITAFVVSTNESDATFNLKNYLLVLAKNFNSGCIWYCENAIRDKKGTYKIELVSNTNDFGEVLGIVKDTTFNDLPQLLTNLTNKQIEFCFHKNIKYGGLPFGIIFIAGNSDDLIDIDDKTKKLESCCYNDRNNRFDPYPITIEDYLILDNLKSCFVFQDKPNVVLFDNDENDRPFNLKKYLLGLKEKLGFEPTGIFYCENANTHKIELIGNDSDFKGVLLEFSENMPKAPNEIPQFLTNFKNSKIPNEKISFSATKKYSYSCDLYEKFKKRVRYTFDRYSWHGYSKIPQEKKIAKIKEQVNEEIKLDPFFCSHRVSSEQNRKINEIAESLKSGKIIGEKIVANAFDLNASYCFITPNDLKNLKERLFIQQDIDITHVINQKKGEAFDHILINDIKYNLLDNTFHFIFNVDNSSQLTIKVPRKDLENYELPNTKKDIFNNLINIRRIDENLILKNNEEITNDLNPLLEQLKTQEFPLSDAITKAINQKEEGIALDYALINDIKYNLLDNTFHFIFNVGNSLLKESSQLIIEVPREALDLENVDRLIKNTLSSHRVCFCSEIHSVCSENSLICHLNQGSYIIDLHLIDD
ncbi:hypothetical protein Kazakh3193_09650 [Helicobacter pylori]